MDILRVLLIFFAAIGGVVLITVGAKRLRTEHRAGIGRTGLLLSVYGFLFILTGLVLFLRTDLNRFTQHGPSDSTEAPLSTNDERPNAAESPSKPVDKPEVSATAELPHDEAAERNDHKAAANRKTQPKKTLQERASLKSHAETAIGDIADAQMSDSPPPTERIYYSVSRVFDSIEQWFMRYGSPSNASSASRYSAGQSQAEKRTIQLHFPDIVFDSGTAELQLQSRESLRKLAADLKKISSPVSLEIQARVDSIGPEPFNYILTQARVDVVRDALIQDGVNTQRLVATALGSQGTDSIKTGSQIRFVLRP